MITDPKDLLDTRIETHRGTLQNRGSEEVSYILKKTRRYAAAMHLATDHIGQDEALRCALRTSSLELMSSMASGSYEQLHEQLLHTLSLLEVAAVSRLISPPNISILRRESYLLIELGRQQSHVSTEILESSSKILLEEDQIPSSTPAVPRKQSTQRSTQNRSGGRGQRGSHASEILEKMPLNEALSISEIRVLLPTIPPKTLQRELAHLVAKGALNKAGSRRWSTYIRAQG